MKKLGLSFGDILQVLCDGKLARREVWPLNVCIVKQIDSDISSDIVSKMQSLPGDAKTFVGESVEGAIHYRSQCLKLKTYPDAGVVATNYIPDWLDMFANDWMIVE